MANPEIELTEKYERNGWPSLPRPDIQAPSGWSIPLLTGINRIYNHRLSPDGKNLAYIWNREGFSDVYICPSQGGWPRRITFDRPARQYWWDEIPRWSPDGGWLAFCMNKQAYLAPVSGSIPNRISNIIKTSTTPRWLPDGEHLLITIEQPDADRLYLISRDGSSLKALTDNSGDARDPQVSPDGKYVAYAHRSFDDLNRYEIRIVDIAAGTSRELTGEVMQKDWQPRWSPDSKKIAYLSYKSGFYEVWLADLASGKLQQLTHAGMDIGDMEWSHDGKFLAVTLNRDGILDLAIVNSATGEIHDLWKSQGIFTNPNWSPNNDFLTVEYNDPSKPPDIFRINLIQSEKGFPAIKEIMQVTFSRPPALEGLHLILPEKVRFLSSDNVEVPALLYKPVNPNGAAIVHPHGGPRDQSIFEWQVFVQYLVAKGYTYLEVNYRGSTGYGKKYEFLNQNSWGIGDTQDVIQGAKYLASQKWVDRDRIAVMGGSYGGYLTICSLARDPDHRFACGIAIYGDADLYSSWALCERDTRLYTEMQLGHPSLNTRAYKAGSPIYQVKDITKPMLILHGLEDEIVPPQASEVLVEALKREGKIFEYKTYARESHGFLNNAVNQDVYSRIERFLDWYLLPKPG